MKNFIKACLIAVLVFVVAGIVLLVVAAAGGVTRASLRLISEEERLNFGPVKVHIGDGFSVDLAGNLDDDWGNNKSGKYLINEEGNMILQANGVYSLNKEVTELYVDVDAGSFTFLPSEDEYFYIENSDDKIRVNYDNGRLAIEREPDIHLVQIGFAQLEDVTIYVPEGVTFDVISIEVGAGDVEMNLPLTATSMVLDVDAGSITANDEMVAGWVEMDVDAGDMEILGALSVSERLDVSVDAGNISIDQLDCDGVMDAECDAGSIEIDGHVYNDMIVSCDAGSISVNLAGNGSDYTYEIESSVAGNVTINGNSFSGFDNDIILPSEAVNAPIVKVSCDAGDVEIDIH